MAMLFNLLNQRNNAVVGANRKLGEFLKVQLPSPTRVEGKTVQYTPNRPYYSEEVSGDVLEALNQLNTLGKIVTPELELALANSGLKDMELHQPVPQWSPDDSEIRRNGINTAGGAKPTSSALRTILYDPKSKVVHYNFRSGNKTYHSFMSNEMFNNWITAPSIGKFWNQYLRTPGVGPVPRTLEDGTKITSYKLPSAGSPTIGDVPVASGGNGVAQTGRTTLYGNASGMSVSNPVGTISTWELLRMLLRKMGK